MYIGATEQEVQESKKQELKRQNLTNYDRRRSTYGEINNPIYFYNPDGRLESRNLCPEEIYVPIENYSARRNTNDGYFKTQQPL